MARPTILDLARAAGVSRATVNRMLADPETVRIVTRQRIADAAAEIGFYGLPAVQAAARPDKPLRVFMVLQQPNRWFCETYAAALRAELGRRRAGEREIRLTIEHLSDLSPDTLCDRMRWAAKRHDLIAVLAAEHPMLTEAIAAVTAQGTPVHAVVTPLTTPAIAGYVGLDGHRIGRLAAWAMDRLCHGGARIGILVGSPRYRVHELAEAAFRSYFREHHPEVQLIGPLATYESDGIALEVTSRMLADHPDLSGLFICCGGTRGALAALRDSGRARDIATIAYDLSEVTRPALLDGTVDMVIAHPFDHFARETLDMFQPGPGDAPSSIRYVESSVYTPENL